MNTPLRIGITGCGKYANYEQWIRQAGGLETVRLDVSAANAGEIARCDGLLLTGGEDLHPALYGREECVDLYGLADLRPERDRFEYDVVARALERKIPVLGICRGLQLVNVYLGGTLVPDIPAILKDPGHGKIAGADQTHPVSVLPGSLLHRVIKIASGTVNSAHHQSAARTGAGLLASAVGGAGITEALEWAEPQGKSWLLLVQWHPERMTAGTPAFRDNLRLAFLEASRRR